MKSTLTTSLNYLRAAMLGTLLLCAQAWAQGGPPGPGGRMERYLRMSPEERQQAQARWRNLPPEQKVQARQEIRDHLWSMTPEQRQQMRQQMREHWQQMPPDDRRAWREQRQTQRETWQGQREERRMQREAWRNDRPYRGGQGWRGGQ